MEHLIEECFEMKNQVFNEQSFIKSIITGNETYGHDPETNVQ